ncbi:NucA/NucB deoxyribonuclease domain-containing protein [Streptomyces sp. NPDC048595]|uniref:NucA/NucB deoxyribonuclease domain-containing protein n=1 Tax=Streptomyces sp. NPDC048595 TaxID=3365576 RepID=UPI003713E946
MKLKVSLRNTALAGSLGALMFTGLAAGASASASSSPAPAEKGTFAAAGSIDTDASASAGSSRYTRFTGTATGPFTYRIWDARNPKKTLGLLKGTVRQTEVLNYKRNTFQHRATITITTASGVLKNGASAKMKLNCGKDCSTGGYESGALKNGKSTVFNFTVKSGGTKTVKLRPQPTMKITGGGVTGPASGDGLAAVRCDSTYKSMGRGCVFPGVQPVFSLSRTDPEVNENAQHVYDAQRKISGAPGLNKPLHKVSTAQQKKNRGKMCPTGPSHPRPAGKECDEYPFASTEEGGNKNLGSTRLIDKDDNQAAGKRLRLWYKDNRVIVGDPFWVHIK